MEGISSFPDGKHEGKLAALHQKIGQKTKRKKVGFLRIAASIALLIVAGGAFFMVNKGMNSTAAEKTMAYEPVVEQKNKVDISREATAIKEAQNDAITTIEVDVTNAPNDYPLSPTTEKDKKTVPKPKSKRKKKKGSPQATEDDAMADKVSDEIVDLQGNMPTIEKENEKAAEASPKADTEEAVSGFTLAELDAELQMDSITTAQPEQKYIIGTVRSSNQEPLIGVNIQVAGTDVMTISDLSGNFKLEWGADIGALEFSYLGFEKTVTSISGPGEVEVMMDENKAELSEVRIISSPAAASKKARTKGVKSASIPIPSALISSYRKFDKYVRRHKKHPRNTAGEEIKGNVHLQFTVQADGEVSNIIVLTSTNDALNAEAIRLLKSGPEWKNRVGMAQLREYVLVFE